jgi:hypothetical protein
MLRTKTILAERQIVLLRITHDVRAPPGPAVASIWWPDPSVLAAPECRSTSPAVTGPHVYPCNIHEGSSCDPAEH